VTWPELTERTLQAIERSQLRSGLAWRRKAPEDDSLAHIVAAVRPVGGLVLLADLIRAPVEGEETPQVAAEVAGLVAAHTAETHAAAMNALGAHAFAHDYDPEGRKADVADAGARAYEKACAAQEGSPPGLLAAAMVATLEEALLAADRQPLVFPRATVQLAGEALALFALVARRRG